MRLHLSNICKIWKRILKGMYCMARFLSIVLLYNRASCQKIIMALVAVPLLFMALFLCKAGNPAKADGFMLLERGFGGMVAVLILIVVIVIALMAVSNALNGRKDLKATHATVGYIMRRMHTSPIGAYAAVLMYSVIVIILIWAVAILSLLLIGKLGLTMASASGIETKLALGLLRTEIGHALLPVSHPAVLIFNFAVLLALAGECARSCYLTWHNGSPSAGIALIVVAMFYVWACDPDNTFIFLTVTFLFLYGALSVVDVIFREKRPKGDPFKVNKYAGIMDMNTTDFDDEQYLEANSLMETADPQAENGYLAKYGRDNRQEKESILKKLNLFRIRRRFMPLGCNLEKRNTFFGLCIFIGMAEHLLFFGRYQMELKVIENSMKGATVAAGLKMPYFWELQEHAYYGYILGIILVLALQMYWNYAYYNKETKSIYVMKRLPNRKEYPRTIWVQPVIEAAIIIMIMTVHTCIDLLIYTTTPDLALHWDYLSHILPF